MNSSGDDDDGDDDILDLAASLGGSLMKDLLADLAVNEDDAQEWLHLEQLERELHHLDLTSAAAATEQQQPTTAAGMIVSSHAAAAAAQAFGTGMMTMYSSNNFVVKDDDEDAHNALDAWSLSLQKFTASSVAADFLQADSARKQQQAAPPSRPPPGMSAFNTDSSTAMMDDYDITSTATVPLPLSRGPPPGIAATAGKQVMSQAAAKLVQDLQTVQEETISPPSAKKLVVPPVTSLTQDQFKTPDEIESPEELVENSAISRSETSTPLLVRQLQKGLQAVHETEVLQDDHDDEKEDVSQQQTTSRVPKPLPITPHNSMGYAPSSIKTTPTPQPTPIASKPMNQAALAEAMPPMPLMPPIVAVPLPAWSQPPPPVPRRVVFANPHPAAPPIHAEQLVSRYMTARDICYVVHSLMRPLLTAETAGLVSNYHLQYWTRHYPNAPPPEKKTPQDPPPTKDWLAHELASRAKKAHAWSESNKTLGTPSKTNVTRPRALVSVTTHRTLNTATTTTDRGDPSKQRAALWKARIYCDQAYQALQDVTDSWKRHGRAAAQTPLLKLFKCLGIGWQLVGTAPVTTTTESTATASGTENTTATDAAAEVHQQYSVDPMALQLLLQLAKGKVLLARVLEQALLPPTVIPVLLPVALELQCSSRTVSSTSKSEELDVADDRVFGAWTAVLRTLPMIPGEALVTTVGKIQKYPDTALATTARMQCVHALLQRGGELAAASSTGGHHNPAFAKQWAQTEQEFMSILA